MLSLNQSKSIDATRVFMVLGVILIHCNILGIVPDNHTTTIPYWTVTFFSKEWPRFCVPWFFFISAYICGKKYGQLTLNSYTSLLRKRTKSILIPYFLWNTLALLIWQAVNLSFQNQYTSGGYIFTTIGQFFIDVYVSPILVPLWFLRNLFVFILALPLLKLLLRFNTVLFIAISLTIEYFTPLNGIVFYSLGLIFANHDDKLNLIFKKSYTMGILYSIVALYSTISGHSVFDIPLLGSIIILIGLFAFWGVSQNIKALQIKNSSSIVFFMYAFHGIISPYVIKGLALICSFHGLGYIVYYIATFVIVVLLSYLTYLILNMEFPRMAKVLTGQRSYNYRPY